MKSNFCSKFLLRSLLEDFDVESFETNQKYLEDQISRLERMQLVYLSQSIDKKVPPRIRARARDLEQNSMGLINGIKFALSFMMQKDEDLDKLVQGSKI